MPKALLIGIDVGTTSTKVVIFDRLGHVLAQASQEYPTHYPHPGWAEQDPDDWWRATANVLRQLFAQHPLEPSAVAGIGVSCQAPTLVAVDQQGRPLYPALIWMDRRSEAECVWLHEVAGADAISRINGGRIDPFYLGAEITLVSNAGTRYLPTNTSDFTGQWLYRPQADRCV